LGYVFPLIIIIVSLVGCSENKTNNKLAVESMPDADTIFFVTAASLREVAWNHLSEVEKTTVTDDWREAKVTIVKWEDRPLRTNRVLSQSRNPNHRRLRRQRIRKKPTGEMHRSALLTAQKDRQ
jgi:hypothetical protein